MYGARVDRGAVVLAVTEEELEELIGSVAAQANAEPDLRLRRRLDAAFDSLETAALHVDQLRVVKETTGSRAGKASAAQAGAAGLPDLDVARVRRWCAARVPGGARHQVYVECPRTARHLAIVERRAPWSKDSAPEWTSLPIAQLRYDHATQTWALFAPDRNLRFHPYDALPSSPQIDVLLTKRSARTRPASSGDEPAQRAAVVVSAPNRSVIIPQTASAILFFELADTFAFGAVSGLHRPKA